MAAADKQFCLRRFSFPRPSTYNYNELVIGAVPEAVESAASQSPLVVWNDVLLDGHNRYEICLKHAIDYETVDIDLPGLDDAIAWIEENQLGRRNLTPDQLAYYIGRKYDRQKKAPSGRATCSTEMVI